MDRKWVLGENRGVWDASFWGLELMAAGEDTYLCFWISFTPFFKFPNLSDGLSL